MAQSSTSVTSIPRTYNFKQVETLWIQAGGDKFIAPVMAAIAFAENGGPPRANATSPRNKDGTVDRGIWQINSSHGYGQSSYDPQQNAKQAVTIYRSQGLNAWTTFKTGAYLKYYPASPRDKTALNNFLRKNPQIGAGKGPAANPPSLITKGIDAIPGATDVLHPVRTVQNAADSAASGIADTIMIGLKEGMYALAIVGGAMFILVGLAMIGLDVGLGGFQSVQRHPVIQVANRTAGRVTSKGAKASAGPENTGGGGNLPGPEA